MESHKRLVRVENEQVPGVIPEDGPPAVVWGKAEIKPYWRKWWPPAISHLLCDSSRERTPVHIKKCMHMIQFYS